MTPSSPGSSLDHPLPRLVHARRFAGDADCSWHVHDAHELVLLTHGRCDIVCGQRQLDGRPGSLFILPLGLPQYQITHGFTRTSYICFTAPASLFSPAIGTLELPLEAPAARWFEDICDLDAGPAPVADAAIAGGLLLSLLAWLGHMRRDLGADGQVHPALAEAMRLLTQRLRQPFDLRQLAGEVGLSAVHLSRLFRLRFGCGPLRWQQQLRLRAAERQLTASTRPIGSIARDCGYDDVSYFIRLFRARYRQTPGSWRGRIGAQAHA